MGNGVIIAAHGEYAKGLKSGLDLVVGQMSNLRVVNFLEGDTYDTIDKALNEAYNDLKDFNNILVITDLKGGTPFNRSVSLFNDKDNVRVLSGLNFALTYQALVSEEEDIDKYLNEVIETGKESIDYFAILEKEEDDELDGI